MILEAVPANNSALPLALLASRMTGDISRACHCGNMEVERILVKAERFPRFANVVVGCNRSITLKRHRYLLLASSDSPSSL